MSSIYLIDYYSNSIDSIIHRSSIISKLIFLVLVLSSILLTKSLINLLFIVSTIFILIIVAKLPFLKILKWSLFLVFFASLFAVSQIGYGLLPIQTTLKAMSASLLMLLIICTTPYPEIFSIFNRISTTLASIMFLSYRFFFLLLDEIEMKLKAIKIRGGYSGSLIKRMKNIGMLIGSLFILSIEKSERIYNILRIRGFKGKVYCFREHEFAPRDLLLIGIGLIILLGMFV
ncbi:MAG: energy-coupling factor transporter transmembrane component T [Candidatus Aenigmarchaeota archaeon]|nr:energy-coupling factor transporter transmembrane component T [Candidatus Aenigmarchaeota archaeon]